jgi:hypothetical protein
MLHVLVGRGGLAHPLSRAAVRPRRHRRNVRTGRQARPHRDDPNVIPAALPGQSVLFPARRVITSEHVDRIRDRTWTEWPRLADLAVALAAERGLSASWRRQVLKLVRAALAMRDADGARLVAEEYLDQAPGNGLGGAIEVLHRAGLLQPRAVPKNRWPTGSCAHCECWGVTTGLCRGCESWKHDTARYTQGPCTRCTRTLPLSSTTSASPARPSERPGPAASTWPPTSSAPLAVPAPSPTPTARW